MNARNVDVTIINFVALTLFKGTMQPAGEIVLKLSLNAN